MSIERAQQIIDQTIGGGWTVDTVERIGAGKGVFSHVERVTSAADDPVSVVIKHATGDANGLAARASGAYERERLAYDVLLPATPTVRAPICHGWVDVDGFVSFVLEDLTALRSVDQLDGLGPGETVAVVESLLELHRSWQPRASDLSLRQNTPASLPAAGLDAGVEALRRHWGDDLDETSIDTLAALARRRADPIGAFVTATAMAATLCHGDARADNLVFADTGGAVLFDWQQIALQFGEADLAWLLATSLDPSLRRGIEAEFVATYALGRRQDANTTWERYRAGMVLPGLAVLFLAQRTTPDGDAGSFVLASLRRIAAAVSDLDVVSLRG